MEHHHTTGLVFFTDLSRFSALTKGMAPDQLADFTVAHAQIVRSVKAGDNW